MLERIEIKNFKAIQGDDKPLILNNLANVNYLVGANGCGKSSVLERFFESEYINSNIVIKSGEEEIHLNSNVKTVCFLFFSMIILFPLMAIITHSDATLIEIYRNPYLLIESSRSISNNLSIIQFDVFVLNLDSICIELSL